MAKHKVAVRRLGAGRTPPAPCIGLGEFTMLGSPKQDGWRDWSEPINIKEKHGLEGF